jgi:hypothetical protein
VVGDLLMIGFGPAHFQALGALRPGDEIQIDNSIYLAAQTYHRHQVPGPEYYVWNQYRGPDGKPFYPQRPLLPGQEVQSGGATQSGRFNCKVIVMQALWDEAAYPWSADWYRTRVKAALGSQLEHRYRLWYVDNTMHTTQNASPNDPRPVVTTRVISYQGVLQQALRDLAAWVEKGVSPPESTTYKVVDGQVIVPPTAGERKGVQLVVSVQANGGPRADVKVGQAVEFSAVAETPPKAGVIIKAEWDFEGAPEYPVVSEIKPQSRVVVTTKYAFSKPGTYFPALRVTSNRQGDTRSPYAQVQNLGRLRVVVT